MQQLHDLSWEIRRLCKLVEQEIREITVLSKRSNAMQSNASVKIDSLHRRVDSIDAKIDLLFTKIATVQASINAIKSDASVGVVGQERVGVWSEQGETSRREDTLQETTPRERQILGVLFNYGTLSYRDIAGYLGITPITAKSLVNRMLEDLKKSRLLVKHRDGRELKVSLAPEIEQAILKKKRQIPVDAR